jgi:putative endonuclease
MVGYTIPRSYTRHIGEVQERFEPEAHANWQDYGGDMFHVYVLWSKKLRKRYVGSASNVDQRFRSHNSGGSRFTKSGIPWILVHVEESRTLSEARQREKFLKSGVGRAWLDRQFPNFKRD